MDVIRSLVTVLALAACTGGDPVTMLADAPVAVDAAPVVDTAPAACVAPTAAGTMHGGSVNAAETWTAAASPHLLPYDTSIYAALTIEPCAVVRLAAGVTVTIDPTGSLVAAGAAGLPVTIEALAPGKAWASIRNLGGVLSLSHAVVRGGGAPLSSPIAFAGSLHMQSNSASALLHVDDVEIADSQSQGIYVNGQVGFDTTSQNVRIHGAAGFPIHVYASVLGSIPTGTYTGNARDAIGIAGVGSPVLDAQTMHDRGVPYHIGSGTDGGRLDVNSQVAGRVAVLTIEPGVTLEFPPGGTINIDPVSGTSPAQGALIAVGTAARPIVFTSDRGAAAVAGDWLGLGFGQAVDPRSLLGHVRVEFAGGAGTGSNSCPYPGRVGQNDAAIRIYGPVASQFITDTAIVASARDGIDRGWRADLQPDFLTGNSFDVAGCKQSTPRTSAGSCPAAPPCP